MIQLYQGDCLEEMKKIPDGSVDMILCDLPYGTTQCRWDNVIPFEPLWENYKRVCKQNAAIVLFSQMPFTIDLINSNRKDFRYEWIWRRSRVTGFLNAKKMPLRCCENITVFYSRCPTYNPQGLVYNPKVRHRKKTSIYNDFSTENYSEYDNYPVDFVCFASDNTPVHPTQKPVPLLEYLIKTYTNEGETILDNTMGSGSTGVACVNTNRNFIGIELDSHYFDVAKERIEAATGMGSV